MVYRRWMKAGGRVKPTKKKIIVLMLTLFINMLVIHSLPKDLSGATNSFRLAIAYSGNVEGYLEPCG
jgi:hypothetical protein